MAALRVVDSRSIYSMGLYVFGYRQMVSMTSQELSDREKATKEALEAAQRAIGSNLTDYFIHKQIIEALAAYRLPPEPIPLLPEWDDAGPVVQGFFISRYRHMQTMTNQYPSEQSYATIRAKNDYNEVRKWTSKPA